MSKVGRWSTTANNNNATPPDGWPEGQAPSTVNDCAREMMASIRTMLNDVSFIDLDHSPTQTTSTTFTMPGNVVSFYDVGRRVKAFDASTLYGTVISSSFTTNTGVTLRLDSGVLTSSFTSVAVSALGNTNMAIPDSVARVENALINGDFDVWQEGVLFTLSGAGVASTVYVADMWAVNQVSTATLNISRSERSAAGSNVPTVAQCGVLLNCSMCISVSAVDAAIAAGDYCYASINIQGATWSKIAQKPNMLTFGAQSNRTGTYCISLRNAGSDRTYVQTFQISTVSAWEMKSFQIPESPVAGTWDYSTGSGLEIGICLASGSGWQTTNAGQWTATAAIATSAQVNFLASAGNTLRLANFRYYEGNSVMQTIPVGFGDTLVRCQRFVQKSYSYADPPGTGTANGRWAFNAVSINFGALVGKISFSPTMNSTPATLVMYSDFDGQSGRANQGIGAGGNFIANPTAQNEQGFCPLNNSGGNQPGMFFHWFARSPLK